VFELKWQGFSLRTGVFILAVLLLPLIVLAAIGQQKYWISVSFGALFVLLSDPGGDYADRAARMAEFAVIGALLTALGFGVGGEAWGWPVLAAFVITLLAGLAVKFGVRRFASGMLFGRQSRLHRGLQYVARRLPRKPGRALSYHTPAPLLSHG